MLSLDTLRVIWWVLLGVLFIGFALTDGFDLGVAALLPWITRREEERRMVLHTIDPVWEGNQTWIILGAGAVFAAWPYVYAVLFSSTYMVILILLLTLGILRPVGFKYRNKVKKTSWRAFWDSITFIGGFVPAVLLGIIAGNILQGLPFAFNNELHIVYQGTVLLLLNPFALWCGCMSLLLFLMHGGLYLAMKTHDPIRRRVTRLSQWVGFLLIFVFAITLYWMKYLRGYQLTSPLIVNHFSNPLHKTVLQTTGASLQNFMTHPYYAVMPGLGFLGAILVVLFPRFYHSGLAFAGSVLCIIGIMSTFGLALFPFILPSSSTPSSSLMVYDASSSQLTLMIMLIATAIFIPIILLYTAWVYRVLWGKVDRAAMKDEGVY